MSPGPITVALIVWNNGESHLCGGMNDTWCIAVEASLLDDVLKLMELDTLGGTVMAVANEPRWCNEHYVKTPDDWMKERAFSLCLLESSMNNKDNMPALLKLPARLRRRFADALLANRGHHESWNPKIEKIVAELRQL